MQNLYAERRKNLIFYFVNHVLLPEIYFRGFLPPVWQLLHLGVEKNQL